LDMELTLEELKKLVPNFNVEQLSSYLSYLGITELTKGKLYRLSISRFLMSLVNTACSDIPFNEKCECIFNMYDLDKNGYVVREEINALLTHFNETNSLQFDKETLKSIENILFEKLDPNGD